MEDRRKGVVQHPTCATLRLISARIARNKMFDGDVDIAIGGNAITGRVARIGHLYELWHLKPNLQLSV